MTIEKGDKLDSTVGNVVNFSVADHAMTEAIGRVIIEQGNGAACVPIYSDVTGVIQSAEAGEKIKLGHIVSDGYTHQVWEFIPIDEQRRRRVQDFPDAGPIELDKILPAWCGLCELGPFRTAAEIIEVDAAGDAPAGADNLSLTDVQEMLGLGSTAMARAMGVPYDTYKNWRSGRYPMPDVATRCLELLCMYPRTARRLGAK